MSFSKIVVALDFSMPMEGLLSAAVELARSSAAVVHLVHVLPLQGNLAPVVPVLFVADQITEAIAHAERRLEEARGTVRAAGAPRVESTLLYGDPATEIVGLAARIGADLVAVGSHGRSGLARLMVGSVAEGVVRRAPCPVLVWRERR